MSERIYTATHTCLYYAHIVKLAIRQLCCCFFCCRWCWCWCCILTDVHTSHVLCELCVAIPVPHISPVFSRLIQLYLFFVCYTYNHTPYVIENEKFTCVCIAKTTDQEKKRNIIFCELSKCKRTTHAYINRTNSEWMNELTRFSHIYSVVVCLRLVT